MRIAGTVILYNPPNNILNNIETYLDDLEFLLIYDNSSNNHAEKHFKNNSKFHYIWEGENKGIAVRLNNAIETWLPYVTVDSIDIQASNESKDRNRVNVSIKYKYSNNINLNEVTFTVQG